MTLRFSILLFALSLAPPSASAASETAMTDSTDPSRASAASGAAADSPALPLVIAHRGASGERPEHTLAAYALAIEQGADVIEPDLVMTGDGVLVARHDIYLSSTTDVADHPEFADRRRLDDTRGDEADWFVADFTLEELKTLRAVQPFLGRDEQYDGQFEIPTFREVIELALDARRETGRMIHLYPETKAPEWHAERKLAMLEPLLAELERAGLNHAEGGVFIQSFEPGILKALEGRTPLPRVQLVFMNEDGVANIPLATLAAWAEGVGPQKALLMGIDGEDLGFVAEAHELGLFVHPWTFRNDRLPPPFVSGEDELQAFMTLHIDGFFTDFPATGRRVVDVVGRVLMR